jgi:hypothetical protein
MFCTNEGEADLRLLIPTCVAAALTLASAAYAQPVAAPSATTADANCLLEMVALSNSNDPDQQRLGQNGVFYFAGRVAARDPSFDFAGLKAMASKLNMQTAQADLQQHCAPMFEKSMSQVAAALAPPASTAPAAPAAPQK